MKIDGWNINKGKDGYYRAYKRICGRVTSVHVGRQCNGGSHDLNLILKLRRHEQIFQLVHSPPQKRKTQDSSLLRMAALKRSTIKLSGPMDYLSTPEKNFLVGRILDYGCGYGSDADILMLDKYDPNFFPEPPTGNYDTVVCNYVVNVLYNDKQVLETLTDIKQLLHRRGHAYITVWRLKNPWQARYGVLFKSIRFQLPVLTKDKTKIIYILNKTTKLGKGDNIIYHVGEPTQRLEDKFRLEFSVERALIDGYYPQSNTQSPF